MNEPKRKQLDAALNVAVWLVLIGHAFIIALALVFAMGGR